MHPFSVPNHAVLSSIEGPRYLFQAVSQFLLNNGKEALFDVCLVGLSQEVKLREATYTVHVNSTANEVKHTDLIFLPALIGDMEVALETNKDFVPWIVQQYRQGAELASLCAGVFFLASLRP